MLTAVATSLSHPLCGRPLPILAAHADALEAVRRGAADVLRILGAVHLSDHDTYFVTPVDALPESGGGPTGGRGGPGSVVRADGTPDLVLRSLVVRGALDVAPGRANLAVLERWEALGLVADKPFDATVRLRRDVDLVPQLNRLPFAQCSTSARLFDRDGLARVVRSTSFAGTSWSPDLPEDEAADADPTWVWSRRAPGAVHVHLAIVGEYEERYALVNPVRVRL